jgi:WD40 repeat protein
MDLMGDIGLADQLTNAREENKVLAAMTKDLQEKVKKLTVENHALLVQNQGFLAELEEYRREAAMPSFSKMALGKEGGETTEGGGNGTAVKDDAFVRTGDGVFPSDAAATLKELHGPSNPLCCGLHPDDSLLVTGGADSALNMCQWGTALAPGDDASAQTVKKSVRVNCPAPVISTAFATQNKGKALALVAAGCMDGSVHLAGYENGPAMKLELLAATSKDGSLEGIKHKKYVKCMSWSPSAPILATASADGMVKIIKITSVSWSADDVIASASMDDAMDESDEAKTADETSKVYIEVLSTLHLAGAVEAMTFVNNGDILVCYARETSYLSYFDLTDNYKQTKHSVNGGG